MPPRTIDTTHACVSARIQACVHVNAHRLARKHIRMARRWLDARAPHTLTCLKHVAAEKRTRCWLAYAHADQTYAHPCELTSASAWTVWAWPATGHWPSCEQQIYAQVLDNLGDHAKEHATRCERMRWAQRAWMPAWPSYAHERRRLRSDARMGFACTGPPTGAARPLSHCAP
jgi:hypothetical protein